MGNNLNVTISSLPEVNTKIIEHTNNILLELDKITTEFDKLDKCFDSDVAKEYRRILDGYIKKTKSRIKSNNYELSSCLKGIEDIYTDLNDKINNTIDYKGDIEV